jgi:hypothetical protein
VYRGQDQGQGLPCRVVQDHELRFTRAASQSRYLEPEFRVGPGALFVDVAVGIPILRLHQESEQDRLVTRDHHLVNDQLAGTLPR